MPAVAAGQQVIPQKTRQGAPVMTRIAADSDQEDANGLAPSAAGLSKSTPERRGRRDAASTARKVTAV
jgi:hypothetical protein